MAMIPSKSNSKFISVDTLNFGAMILLLGVVLISSNLIQNVVHESLQIFAIPSLVLIVVFLLFPNRNNQGKNGTQRILICSKFYAKKMKGWLYK